MKKHQKSPLWVVRKRASKKAKRAGHKQPRFKAPKTKIG